MTRRDILDFCRARGLLRRQNECGTQECFDKVRKEIQYMLDSIDEITHPIGADCEEPFVEKARTEEEKKEEEETFNGMKATNYSQENWERIKKSEPVIMPKILRPRRLDSKNSVELYTRKIIFSKQNENTRQVNTLTFYDYASGIKLCAAHNRESGIEFIKKKMKEDLSIIDFLESKEGEIL